MNQAPKWIEIIHRDEIKSEEMYFIGFLSGDEYLLAAEDINRKPVWSVKPGIAIRLRGDRAREALNGRENLVAIRVPKDADARWRRRKPLR